MSKVDPWRISGFVLLIGMVLGPFLTSHELFINLKSFVILVLATIVLSIKHGTKILKLKNREQVIVDGIFVTSMCCGIVVSSILIASLFDLDNMIAVGPMVAFVALSLYYALVMICIVYVPLSRKSLSWGIIIFPCAGTLLLVMTLFMLLLAFA